MSETDIYNLQRFVDAQEQEINGYKTALQEMKDGRKKSHWIWYIIPQLKGLSKSEKSDFYGITELNEAKEYLKHPILGTRLREILGVIAEYPEDANPKIFMMWHVDAKKLKACATLFYRASGEELFKTILDRFFKGEEDSRTLEKLQMENEE